EYLRPAEASHCHHGARPQQHQDDRSALLRRRETELCDRRGGFGAPGARCIVGGYPHLRCAKYGGRLSSRDSIDSKIKLSAKASWQNKLRLTKLPELRFR